MSKFVPNHNEAYKQLKAELLELSPELGEHFVVLLEIVRVQSYEWGWVTSADWVEEWHLCWDVGSPRYLKDMTKALGMD